MDLARCLLPLDSASGSQALGQDGSRKGSSEEPGGEWFSNEDMEAAPLERLLWGGRAGLALRKPRREPQSAHYFWGQAARRCLAGGMSSRCGRFYYLPLPGLHQGAWSRHTVGPQGNPLHGEREHPRAWRPLTRRDVPSFASGAAVRPSW